MPTKSYTLADSTIITVESGDNGVEFNEGMNALTKAINAKINSSRKPVPALSIGGWSVADTAYTAAISYDGDGVLSVDNGTITNGMLTVNDSDGSFNGVITAAEGASSAATKLYFNFDTETVTQTVSGGGKTSPILTVGSFSGLQAPVTYNGDGDLNVLGGSLSGTILTACDYKGVIYSDATANFAPAVSKWQTPIEDYLVAYLPFDSSTTQDLCGGSWTAYGSPQIVDDQLSLAGDVLSGVEKGSGLTLGGKDFTISCKFNMNSSNSNYYKMFVAYNTRNTNKDCLAICRSKTDDALLLIIFNKLAPVFPCSMNTVHHLELDYSHALTSFFIYLDGVFQCRYAYTHNSYTYNYFHIATECYDAVVDTPYRGTFSEFQIFDGIALHTGTKSFAPPTAAEYAALKAKFLS